MGSILNSLHAETKDIGVLSRNGILHEYTMKWRHVYSCFHGGKPRYKDKLSNWKGKSHNAPRSCLMECKAALYTRLLKTVRARNFNLHVN